MSVEGIGLPVGNVSSLTPERRGQIRKASGPTVAVRYHGDIPRGDTWPL